MSDLSSSARGFLWQADLMTPIKLLVTALALTVCALLVAAQAQSKKLVQFTVTDPMNRFVTGLDQKTFEVVENGVRRPITGFWDVDSPMALAIVSDSPLAEASNFNRANDELIQARSVADALRQFSVAKNARKIMVVSTAFDTQALPEGIQVIKVNPNILIKAVVEAHNQYVLEFESGSTSASVEVVLQQPQGLPPLRAHVN
jgi:hypothetical protein